MNDGSVVENLAKQCRLQWDSLAFLAYESYKKGGRGAICMDQSKSGATVTDPATVLGYILEKTLLSDAYSLGQHEIEMVRSYDPATEILVVFKLPGDKLCVTPLQTAPTQRTPKALYETKWPDILGK